jgi:hypothetical protein
MSERNQSAEEKYRRVRNEFDDLDVRERALFLLEATVATMARGIDEFGRFVSREINKATRSKAEQRGAAPTETGDVTEAPGAPEAPHAPETEAGSIDLDEEKGALP